MTKAFDLRLLEDVNALLDKLNKKLDQLIIAQVWLNSFKKDIHENRAKALKDMRVI